MAHVISPGRVAKELRYIPHRGQRIIHSSTGRHRVAACGRRFGKSTLGGRELTFRAFESQAMRSYLADTGQQMRDWIVGPNYDDSEREFRVFWNDLKRLEIPMDKPGSYYNPSQAGGHVVSLWNGLYIVECRSAEHPESLDGEGLDFVIMAEAAKMKRSVWTKFIRPALADKKGGSLWNSTPEGKNHFYEKWQTGQDPKNKAWSSWRLPSWVNEHVFPDGENDPEILEMMNDMSTELFKQEVRAEFTTYVGRVFKEWDEEIHVQTLEYDPSLPLYGAVDYGFTNPNVWLAVQVDKWDNVYVIGEFYQRGLDTNEFANEMKKWPLAANALHFYPDPAGPGDTRIMQKALGMKARTNTGGEIKYRLELMRRHLKPGPSTSPEHLRKPKLLVDRSCRNLIREFDAYRYPDDNSKLRDPNENPMKLDDHTPEALGRFFRGYFGPPGKDMRGGTRVRPSNLGRAA